MEINEVILKDSDGNMLLPRSICPQLTYMRIKFSGVDRYWIPK